MAISTPVSRITEYYSRHGFKATIRRARLALNRALFSNRIVVLYLDLARQSLRTVAVPSSFRIDRLKSESELNGHLLETMMSLWNPKLARRSTMERFASGAQLWILLAEEQLAAYCWTIRGRAIAPYYFPIAPDDVQLFDVYAVPKFRGGAVLWFLIGSMLHALKAEGAARVYADMAEWNRASLAFYQMTPFRRLGVATSFTIFGRKFTSWTGNFRAGPADTVKAGQGSTMAASRER